MNALYLDAQFVKAEIAKLIEAFPDLAEDETLRADMIEGETNAARIIERLLSAKLDDDTMAAAAKERQDDIATRRERFERASEAKKSLIRSIMKAAKLDKLTLPEATLSITKPSRSVGIENVDDLPQGYFRVERKADKAAIKKSLEAGEEVPGAFLVLGSEGLTIRTK